MKAWMLPFRRLWWFTTDMRTSIAFNYPCDHCGDEIVMESRGFRFPRMLQHDNTLCKYGPFFRHHKGPFSWLCKSCRRGKFINYRFWVVNRWRFRLKYTWGVGVPEECLAGNHQWPAQPNSVYEDGDIRWYQGTCLRCGFTHRWGQKLDEHGSATR